MLFTLQRYEFFSKSQLVVVIWQRYVDVVYLAKVRIFQQITTVFRPSYSSRRMLFTLQRYEFFSKSQQVRPTKRELLGCCLPCKGTNFLANHNNSVCGYFRARMLFTLQRYEFFSKSQHNSLPVTYSSRCCLPCKGTNFLANHNYV